MVKKDVEDSVNFISAYCFTQVFHSGDICQEFVKSELAELFQIPCSCGRTLVFIIGCENKTICYKDILVDSFHSPTFHGRTV